MIGASMSDYMTWRMQEEWREKEDAKPIRLDATLNVALNKTSWQIVDAICNALGISSKGKRQDKARKVTDHLTDTKKLRAALETMPLPMKLALQRILDAGGFARWDILAREFGDQEGDLWFWNEKPPRSLLGRLRTRGLLYVGATKVGKTKTRVAMIPTDLREPLAQLLARRANAFAELGNYNLTRAQDALEAHYRKSEYPPVIPRAWLEEYLLAVGSAEGDAFGAWRALEHFDYFLSKSLVEKLDDISPRQLTVWLTTFLQKKYVGDFALADKRAMAKQVGAFYAWLAAQGYIATSLAQQMQDAATSLAEQKKEIAPQELPRPLGGEVIVEGQRGDAREVFTYNDRWLIIVCAVDFGRNLDKLYAAAARVADAPVKQQLIRRLMQYDATLWKVLEQNSTQAEADFAWEWFNNAPVITASAW